VRIAMLSPAILPKAMPLFRGRGEKGHRKFLADLESRGLARREGNDWHLTADD
jgi:hypothetical protein